MDIVFRPRPVQAFNFSRDMHSQIGHVLSFKVGTDAVLTADLMLSDPLSAEGTPTAVCGAIAEVSWGGRPSSSIHIAFVCSKGNRQILSNLIHQSLDNTQVTFEVVVYDFDTSATAPTYYKTLHSNGTPLNGFIKVSEVGGDAEEQEDEDEDEDEDRGSRRGDDDESLASRRSKNKKKAKIRKADRSPGDRTTELVMKLQSNPEEKPQSPPVWKFDISLDPVQYDTGGTPQHIHFATASQHTIVKSWGVEKPS
jgi:hypothetical protein